APRDRPGTPRPARHTGTDPAHRRTGPSPSDSAPSRPPNPDRSPCTRPYSGQVGKVDSVRAQRRYVSIRLCGVHFSPAATDPAPRPPPPRPTPPAPAAPPPPASRLPPRAPLTTRGVPPCAHALSVPPSGSAPPASASPQRPSPWG